MEKEDCKKGVLVKHRDRLAIIDGIVFKNAWDSSNRVKINLEEGSVEFVAIDGLKKYIGKKKFSPKVSVLKNVSFGSDPEFFFSPKGDGKDIIPSIKVLGKTHYPSANELNKIIVDGVQGEFNHSASVCRQSSAYHLHCAFNRLNVLLVNLRKEKKKVCMDFTSVVKVSKKELNSLDVASIGFGCSPSLNIYAGGTIPIDIDPLEYTYRSAGGHLHFGTNDYDMKRVLKNHKIIIPLLDIMVGNTAVLMDREPLQEERRKYYGRAGEYRVTKYGVEYRVLSNFWLRNYTLFSFLTGVSRYALNIVLSDMKYKTKYTKKIMSLVNIEDIKTAINTNNYKLALKNWNKIKTYLFEIASSYNGAENPLCANKSNKINKISVTRFLTETHKKLMGTDFENVLSSWYGQNMGFERFMNKEMGVLE